MKQNRIAQRLPRFVGRIPDMADLFRAEENEFFVMDARVQEFLAASYIQHVGEVDDPEIYLSMLEREYKISKQSTTEARVRAILAKKNSRATTTRAALERAVTAITNLPTEVVYPISPYTMLIAIACADDDVNVDMSWFGKIRAELDEIKPAHLDHENGIQPTTTLELSASYTHYRIPYWKVGYVHMAGTLPYHLYTGRADTTHVELDASQDARKQRVLIASSATRLGMEHIYPAGIHAVHG